MSLLGVGFGAWTTTNPIDRTVAANAQGRPALTDLLGNSPALGAACRQLFADR